MVNLLDERNRGNHHWWPKNIQRHWTNSDGQIHQRKGDIVRPKNPENGKTGCRRNQHYFDVGDSPWSHSFERAFEAVDAEGADIVRLLINRVRETPSYKMSRAKFLSWLPFDSSSTDTKYDCLNTKDTLGLARLALSIAIRSPAFQFRKSFPHPAFSADRTPEKALGTANVWHYWADLYADPLLPRDPLSVNFLIAANGCEFIFGDGIFENVTDNRRLAPLQDGSWMPRFSGGVAFPVSPDICALIQFNSQRGQRLAVLSVDETKEVNTITHLSSREEIYFRTQDQPSFIPQDDATIRKISLDPDSFLKPWFQIISSP